MLQIGGLDYNSDTPLYRQLYTRIREYIETGEIATGERLPPTRELAAQLGLNRTTISAAYELLESAGLITGHVGRGSFVSRPVSSESGINWRELLQGKNELLPGCSGTAVRISFSTSRPSAVQFPIEEFRQTCTEVISGGEAETILQLGPSAGYGPLRRFLLEQAREQGLATSSDDVLITSGCQQAFDLLQRTLVAHEETVILEDPVYPGVKNVLERAGARLIGIPVQENGIDLEMLARALTRERPRMIVVTPNFQNPTGCTMPLEARRELLRMALGAGAVLVENDVYGPLAYEGDPIAPVKRMDGSGSTVLLRSFSKIAFPGLRVGWVLGPRPLIERMTEAKQLSDLHSDQLSQAVLLRFAESGRLEEHRRKVLASGRERLRAALSACEAHLPGGSTWTRPSGGMSLWVRLPKPLDSAELLARAEREGVSYMPGKYFAVSRVDTSALRLSFAGLTPDAIANGIEILGRIFRQELERVRGLSRLDMPALV